MKRAAAAAAIAALEGLSATYASPVQNRNNGPMVYSFTGLDPSPELNWTPCFDNFTCAMLEVPLDYTDPGIGSTGVAFLKWWSANTSAEDILINPGGPGESGVDIVLSGGINLLESLGPDYNIVGFDPRGVNNSALSLECFPGNLSAKLQFAYDVLDRPVDNSSRKALYETWELDKGWGERCTIEQSSNKTKKYANTVAVANDMLRYTELLAKSLGQPAEQSKIWYYGISYGTTLGATFATLFPDRIGRMILDGVVDVQDYYNGGWLTNLFDADAAMGTFYTYCYLAGPERCLFHQNSSSPEELEKRVLGIYSDLNEHPILIADPNDSFTPILLDWREVQSAVVSAIYNGVVNFPSLAKILSDVERRNGTLLGIATQRSNSEMPVNNTASFYYSGQSRTQIACIDANGRFNMSTFEQYEDHVAYLSEQSFYAGADWAAIVGTPCRALDVKPPESQVFNGFASSNDTSAPILFVGNTFDPATPLRSAKKMSSLFQGSAVLTVNGTGHSSYNVRSQCAWKHFQAYLANGTLPPPDTICQADQLPFFA